MVEIAGNRGDTTQVETNGKQNVEDPASERLHKVEAPWQIVFKSEQVEIAEEHAHDEKRTKPAVHDVQEVVDQTGVAPEARIPSESRKGEQRGVYDDGASKFQWNSPCMIVYTFHGSPWKTKL